MNELSNAKQKPRKDSYQGPFEARKIFFASFVLFESSVIIELLDSCSTWGEETIATSRNVSSLFPKDHFSSSNWLSILIYAISVCFLARNRIHQIIFISCFVQDIMSVNSNTASLIVSNLHFVILQCCNLNFCRHLLNKVYV